MTGTTDDEIEAITAGKGLEYYLNFELFERFGYFPVGAAPHVAENFPYYCNDPATLRRHRVRRKGVLPMRAGARPSGAERSPTSRPADDRWASPTLRAKAYRGSPRRCWLAAASARSWPCRMPGRSVIAQGRDRRDPRPVDGRGIHPESSGPVPQPLVGWTQTVIDEQELAVEAALRGDRDLVVQAMTVSPMLASKDAAVSSRQAAERQPPVPAPIFKSPRPRRQTRKQN